MSLSKTLNPLLCPGSTHDDRNRFDMIKIIVDWDVKNLHQHDHSILCFKKIAVRRELAI